MFEDAFTPESEFEEMSNSINSYDSITRPLGDASKIDCQTAREVTRKLLDGEDIYDAQLRGNAIAHSLHCGECRKYRQFNGENLS